MAAGMATISRTQVLQALGVKPLRLRTRASLAEPAVALKAMSGAPALQPAVAQASVVPDNRIALLRSQGEIDQPALAALFTKITEAISALGLQCVRQADAANDPRVRVLAFGEVPLPPTIESARVLRVDSLSILGSDRARKRALWELMQKLAREAGAG